jgi:NADH-quinone oxidoreductase subunit J
MNVAFYVAAAVAVCSTLLAVSRRNAVHALLYLVVSLLSIALVFLLLGAPFAAATEVIIYAGAIMVLFVFVVMMLSMGPKGGERVYMRGIAWVGPAILAAILLAELIQVAGFAGPQEGNVVQIGPHEVAKTLLGPYLLGVELASMLLLSALVGAYHLAYHLGTRSGEKGGTT